MATVDTIRSYDMGGKKESFSNLISMISPEETPFASMTKKEPITNTLYQWQTDRLNKASTTNKALEGDVAPAAVLNNTEVKNGNTQILNKVVAVTDTSAAIKAYGRSGEPEYHLKKAGLELRRDLEASFLSDQVKQASSASTYGLFDGFQSQVATTADPDTGAVVTKVLTTTDPTEADIDDLCYNLYLAGAEPSIIMFHPKFASFFSGLAEKNATTTDGRMRMFDGLDTKFNKYVNIYVSQLGQEMKLIPNRLMPQDAIYFFNPKDWTQKVLREPTRSKMGKTGSAESWLIEMEVGLAHANPYASGVLKMATPAPVLTGFTLTGAPALGGTAAAPTAAITGTGTVVITVAPVPGGATLGAVSATSDKTAAATAAVGTGANKNKVTITGVAVGTANVEIKVAGVTNPITVAVTVS